MIGLHLGLTQTGQASGFVPSDLGSRLYRYGSPLELGLADAALVATNPPLFGSTVTMTAAGADRPTFRTSGINSKAALDFDGATSQMQFGSLSSSARSTWLFAAVMKIDSVAGTRYMWDAQGAHRLICAINETSVGDKAAFLDDVAWRSSAAALDTTAAHVFCWEVSGGNFKMYVDGAQVGATVAVVGGFSKSFDNTAGAAQFGNHWAGGAGFCDCKVGDDAIVFNHTDAERIALTRFMGARYSITVA